MQGIHHVLSMARDSALHDGVRLRCAIGFSCCIAAI